MDTLDVYENINITKVYNRINKPINNVSIDTRKIKEGDIYLGIKGEKIDGNELYKDAFLKGASLAILEHVNYTQELEEYLKANDLSIVVVPDSIKALGELAKFKRKLFKKPVVAITGSAGKTSTKDMVYSVVNEKYNAHKTIGNQNNHIGLPLSILSLDEKTEVLVLEMGMNHLGEIAYLSDIAKPDIAIITNVGTAHIGNLGSRENILKAKLEILTGLKENGKIIINNDNDLLHNWYLENKSLYDITTIGINNESTYMAKDIWENELDSTFKLNDEVIEVPVGGEHFIYNSLVAIAVGKMLDVAMPDIKRGIKDFELSQNRMHIIENKETNITIIDDSYNANFDSISYALKYLANFPGRRIAVLGTMLELGDYSKTLHLNLGDVVYNEDVDVLITVGDYTNLINERAISLGFKKEASFHFATNEEAIALINKIKTSNDIILVKASCSMHFKDIVEKIS